MTTSKRLLIGNPAQSLGTITDAEWAYLRDNNWEIMITVNEAGLTNPVHTQIWIDTFNEWHAHGVDISVSIELPFNSAPASKAMSEGDWEALCGTGIDSIETQAPHITGYFFEGAYDNALTWLRGKTDKIIVEAMFFMPPPAVPPVAWTDETFDWRVNILDEVLFEIYTTDLVADCIEMGAYLRDNFPDKPYDIFTALYADPAQAAGLRWWGISGLSEGILTYNQQLERAMTYLLQIKEDITFNGIGLMESLYPRYSNLPNPIDTCGFIEGLNLCAIGTKPIREMKQTGVIPYYTGVSRCSHDPPPDTFANTGNELILLKNVGTASTHDITVTSTDTATHEDYTIALSPDRGTFIGPYPLEQFGVLPTITYDNTNLYISILKDEPYSE